jgi:monoterpene epsilon-lactone hydrolase
MLARIHFTGPAHYRLLSAAQLSQSVLEVSTRRRLKGPRLPGWNWYVEVITRLLQKQVRTALELRNVVEARRYLDSIAVSSSALAEVDVRKVFHKDFKGSWYSYKSTSPRVTLLYFHGGGYTFYPRAYDSFIAQLTLTAKSRTFALDYRLTPEHRFPAQLEDALNAYRWLQEHEAKGRPLMLVGDSAGGHLALALLLKLRQLKLPMPALTIGLSPPTDFTAETLGSETFDWISRAALLKWRDWFCDPAQRSDPLVSPVRADLRDLPPIYIQAGEAEILYESIEGFVRRAQLQHADVVLESWEDMNHNFQVFGADAPQSVEAFRRIGEVIETRIQEPVEGGALFAG